MHSSRRSWLAVFAVGLALGACTDEKVVYRDRELFSPVEDAAAGFIGFSDEEEKLTVCGTCHFGQQGKWEGSAHADAWASLQNSGHPQAFCEACHTVNALGNAAEGDAGYVAVADSRYHEVQCESCHGAGLPHVTDPSATQPLATLAVGLDMTTGCGECHQGAHHPYVEEWEQSAHAFSAEDGHGASCDPCHNAGGALASFGVDADYLEKGTGEEYHIGVTCAVCHDPHGSAEEGQLRFAVDVPSEEENLCMKCHHKRGTPDPTTWRGPHSPEGPMLLGYAGWWPPNMEFPGGVIVATHGSDANPRLCAGCHVNQYEVTDETGAFVQTATGHLFAAIPCTDAQGVPNAGDCEASQRTFQTCTGGGCHGTEAVARGIKFTAELRLEELAAELDRLLEQVQAGWKTCRTTSAGCGPFKNDGTYTTAEGAAFNYELALYPGSAVHNPFLAEALLTATIRQVKTDYAVSVRSGLVLDNILQN